MEDREIMIVGSLIEKLKLTPLKNCIVEKTEDFREEIAPLNW
jgi:hypothetical protein